MAVEGRAIGLLFTLLAGAALAQGGAVPPPAALLAACGACHGANGQATEPSTPSLAGQPRLFLETQLVLIREGLREVPSMQALLKDLPDETLIALATHYAALPAPQPGPLKSAAQSARGRALSARLLCGSCHLPDYSGQQQVPRLSGQQGAYLLAAMRQLRDRPGPGRDTIMAATLRGLGDSDLEDLAAYFSQQQR